MRVKSKLNKWQDAGLIDDALKDNILAYERAKMSKHFALGMQLCGGFAVLLGFALIIAANWHELGRYAKIFGHFALNIGLSVWLFKTGFDGKKPALQEMLTLAVFGLNLTFIALIGQVFQLDGSTAMALAIWMIISAPLIMVYARSGFVAWIWTVALYLTAFMLFGEYSPRLEDEYEIFILAYFISLFLPLALYADHCMSITQKFRPSFAECFRKTSLLFLVIGASLSSVLFYIGNDGIIDKAGSYGIHLSVVMSITLLAVVYILACMRYFRSRYDAGYDWHLILLSTIFTAAPMVITFESSILAATHFILFWSMVGFIAQKHGIEGVVNLSIALVAIRLYVIFIELFGDALMDTGLGLILAGAVMIGFVKMAKKVKQRISGTNKKEVMHG
jgi:uncharacterized membrane protein